MGLVEIVYQPIGREEAYAQLQQFNRELDKTRQRFEGIRTASSLAIGDTLSLGAKDAGTLQNALNRLSRISLSRLDSSVSKSAANISTAAKEALSLDEAIEAIGKRRTTVQIAIEQNEQALAEIDAGLERLTAERRQVELDLGDFAELPDVKTEIALLDAEIANLGSRRTEIQVSTDDARAQFGELQSTLRDLSGDDAAAALAQLNRQILASAVETERLDAQIRQLANLEATVNVRIDGAAEQVQSLGREIESLESARVEISADGDGANDEIARIDQRLDELSGQKVNLEVLVEDATESVGRVRSLIGGLSAQRLDLAVNSEDAEQEIERFGELLEEASDQSIGLQRVALVFDDIAAAAQRSDLAEVNRLLDSIGSSGASIENIANGFDFVGSALDDLPDLIEFTEQTQRAAEAAELLSADNLREFADSIDLINTEPFQRLAAESEELAAQVDAIKNIGIELKVDVADGNAKVVSLERQIEKLQNRRVKIETEADNADAVLADIDRQIRGLEDKRLQISVEAGPASDEVVALDARISRLQARRLKIEADATQADSEVAAIDAKIDSLSNRRIKVEADAAEAAAALERFNTLLEEGIDNQQALNQLQEEFGESAGEGLGVGEAALEVKLFGDALGAAKGIVDGFLASGLEARQSQEQFFKALQTATGGNVDEAERLRAIFVDFATQPLVDTGPALDSLLNLLNRGLTPTAEQLRQIGDIAASQNKEIDQFVEAVLDAQQGEFERLKEFGVRASVEGDRISLAFKGIEESVENTPDAIANALFALGDAEGVAGALGDQAGTLAGRFSSLEGEVIAIQQGFGKLSEAGIRPLVESAVFLLQTFNTLPEPLRLALFATTAFAAALGGAVVTITAYNLATQSQIAAEVKRATATVLNSGATIKNTAAMAANTLAKVANLKVDQAAIGAKTALTRQFNAGTAALRANASQLAIGAARLGAFAAAGAVILGVVDGFNRLRAEIRQANDEIATLELSLVQLERARAGTDEEVAVAVDSEAAVNLKAVTDNLNILQKALDFILEPISNFQESVLETVNNLLDLAPIPDGVAAGIRRLATQIDNLPVVGALFGPIASNADAAVSGAEAAFDRLVEKTNEVEGEVSQIAQRASIGAPVDPDEIEVANTLIDDSIRALREQAAVSGQDVQVRDAQIARLETYRDRLNQATASAEAATITSEGLESVLEELGNASETAGAQLDANLAGARARLAEQFADPSSGISPEDYQRRLTGIENNGLRERLEINERYLADLQEKRQMAADEAVAASLDEEILQAETAVNESRVEVAEASAQRRVDAEQAAADETQDVLDRLSAVEVRAETERLARRLEVEEEISRLGLEGAAAAERRAELETEAAQAAVSAQEQVVEALKQRVAAGDPDAQEQLLTAERDLANARIELSQATNDELEAIEAAASEATQEIYDDRIRAIDSFVNQQRAATAQLRTDLQSQVDDGLITDQQADAQISVQVADDGLEELEQRLAAAQEAAAGFGEDTDERVEALAEVEGLEADIAEARFDREQDYRALQEANEDARQEALQREEEIALAAIDRQTEASQNLLAAQEAAADVLGQAYGQIEASLDRQTERLQRQGELLQAQGDLQDTLSSAEITDLERAVQIREQLDSGSVESAEERRALEAEITALGLSGQSTDQIRLRLIQEQAEAADRQRQQLLLQQEIEQQTLTVEQQKQAIANQRAVIEARIAVIQQESANAALAADRERLLIQQESLRGQLAAETDEARRGELQGAIASNQLTASGVDSQLAIGQQLVDLRRQDLAAVEAIAQRENEAFAQQQQALTLNQQNQRLQLANQQAVEARAAATSAAADGDRRAAAAARQLAAEAEAIAAAEERRANQLLDSSAPQSVEVPTSDALTESAEQFDQAIGGGLVEDAVPRFETAIQDFSTAVSDLEAALASGPVPQLRVGGAVEPGQSYDIHKNERFVPVTRGYVLNAPTTTALKREAKTIALQQLTREEASKLAPAAIPMPINAGSVAVEPSPSQGQMLQELRGVKAELAELRGLAAAESRDLKKRRRVTAAQARAINQRQAAPPSQSATARGGTGITAFMRGLS